jgi:predicted O-methyltransferase YrrM
MQWAKRRVLQGQAPAEIRREDWPASLAGPSAFYLQAFLYFHQRCPPLVREHRHYFTQERRGFGEDAFHAMWFLLVREFQPRQFLEIGVYRGQVLSLVALLQRLFDLDGQVTGISPFLPAGDSVSSYLENIEYYEDTLAHFRHFKLRPPTLCRAFSTDAAAVALIRSRAWDCIYIDGNHDEAVVRADWAVCSESVKPGGVIVLDDSGLGTAYRPPRFATGGHPGPSALAREIDRSRFQEILHIGHNRVFQRL